ncbi:MAG TPA: hypothetical protein VIQ81_11095 [Gammaproteobacteria bacterium]
MLETLLGGLLAVLGGWGSTYFQLRYARKNKMDEVVAERKVEVNAQAYSHIKDIQGSFLQATTKDTNNLIYKYEQWFFDNRLFLPGKFPTLWLSIRTNLNKYARTEQTKDTESVELEKLNKKIHDDIKEAIDEIYKDMGIKEGELQEYA